MDKIYHLRTYMSQMKKFFVELNGFNAVAFMDDQNRALVIDETEADYEQPLTLEVAKNSFVDFVADTADEAKCELGFGTLIFWDGSAEGIGADKVTEI